MFPWSGLDYSGQSSCVLCRYRIFVPKRSSRSRSARFVCELVKPSVLPFALLMLLQVWRLHGRIKFHVVLTVIALMVNVAITLAGVLMIVDHGRYSLIVISWMLRYVHIALDTLVLYSALETPVFHLESDCPVARTFTIHPQVAIQC